METMLNNVKQVILAELTLNHLNEGTIRHYKHYLDHLTKIAEALHTEFYTADVGRQFLEDISVSRKTGLYDHVRHCYCLRCIQMVESYLASGEVDLSLCSSKAVCPIKSHSLEIMYSGFKTYLEKKKLSENTKCGYLRLVLYFINFMEHKGYNNMEDIKKGDVVLFISVMCQEHYSPTSLGAHITGLRHFYDFAKYPQLKDELPLRLPKKKDILKVYSDDEIDNIFEYIANADNLSFRNKCICMLAFETGLRAVDICNLKLSDIDWKNDTITIIQEKTKKPITFPLRESYGNYLAEYIINERPKVDSEYVFLRSLAPYKPLKEHAAIYHIINDIIKNTGVDKQGRISGTRMTRHCMGSRMLRKGIPLSIISQSLGHTSTDSSIRYISVDEEKLAGLTLPLPKGGLS